MKSGSEVTYDFGGKVAVVTGGARGQGRCHALAFAEAGADVAILDTGLTDMPSIPYPLATAEDLEDTAAGVRATGRRCLALSCDVRDSGQVAAAVANVLGEFGAIDILINNAGVDSVYQVTELAEEAWDVMIDTHMKGTFLMSQQVARAMVSASRGGRIITIGSVNSFSGTPGQAHYTAAKHGLVGFNKAMAIELAAHHVTCNLVCPGSVDTPLVDGLRASVGDWLETITDLTGPWNLLDPGENLDPREISEAVLWLASGAARSVTGQALIVDAGFLAK